MKNPVLSNEIGLNPSFTYVEGNEKVTTTEKPEETTTTTTMATPTAVKVKAVNGKGTFAVKVSNMFGKDSEVTTLPPSMFEYDQYGNKGYYGDRIYMSTVLPVSGRSNDNKDIQNIALFDDFDEMIFDP